MHNLWKFQFKSNWFYRFVTTMQIKFMCNYKREWIALICTCSPFVWCQITFQSWCRRIFFRFYSMWGRYGGFLIKWNWMIAAAELSFKFNQNSNIYKIQSVNLSESGEYVVLIKKTLLSIFKIYLKTTLSSILILFSDIRVYL